ncbi:MAG: TRCF domain-containing protein, partial [Chloroflexota bacterium]
TLNDIAAELADRFGPLPEPVENLLFQMRVKLLAQRASVEAVSHEDGQIVLRSRLWETEEGRTGLGSALDVRARISKGKVWLPRATDEAREGWKEQLISTLERLNRS